MTEKNYSVERLEKAVPMDEYRTVCIDVPKFLVFCEACPSYNTRWSCPPFHFDPMEIWARYDTLHLVAYALTFHPGQDVSSALQSLKAEKAAMLRELLTWEQAAPGSRALSAGTCDLCGQCGKADRAPCRTPERLRYSIEALGGDVGKTMEMYFGKPIQWIRDGVLPEYLTLVGGLLTSRKEANENRVVFADRLRMSPSGEAPPRECRRQESGRLSSGDARLF